MTRRNIFPIAFTLAILVAVFSIATAPARAQGNSGSIDGVVKDANGAVVPGAKVEITNPVSGFHQQATSGTDGSFHFTNVPFNPYHMVVSANGFNAYHQGCGCAVYGSPERAS
jgi:hypothetical protein